MWWDFSQFLFYYVLIFLIEVYLLNRFLYLLNSLNKTLENERKILEKSRKLEKVETMAIQYCVPYKVFNFSKFGVNSAFHFPTVAQNVTLKN